MDTITHALSGVLLGRATKDNYELNEKGLSLRVRMIVGGLAAAFPDIDFIARFFGLLNYLETHRGITHSVILLPLWALLLAHIFSCLSKGRYQWRDFYWICVGGIAIHILGDIITAYGTMMFSPFSETKFSFPTTFILDIYFSGIIIFALIVARIFRQYGKIIAIAGLSTLVSYVGFQAIQLNKAENIALAYVKQKEIKQAKIYVMAQPLSPYHWKAVIESSNTYYISYIDLVSSDDIEVKKGDGMLDKIERLYQPVDKLQWNRVKKYGNGNEAMAKQIWKMDFMKSIRQFMLFPLVDSVVTSQNKKCVWFKDHRFILDGVRVGPFRFGACQEKEQPWRLYHLVDNVAVLLRR